MDRELGELLEEIRVALPGIELLFGFLLILPFSAGFETLDHGQRGVYLACFLATAAAAALFVSPTAQHRLGFRTVDKEKLLRRTNRLVICGLFLIAASISLAVYLITSVVLDSLWARVLTVAAGLWFLTWWFIIPHVWLDRDHAGTKAD